MHRRGPRNRRYPWDLQANPRTDETKADETKADETKADETKVSEQERDNSSCANSSGMDWKITRPVQPTGPWRPREDLTKAPQAVQERLEFRSQPV